MEIMLKSVIIALTICMDVWVNASCGKDHVIAMKEKEMRIKNCI